MTSKIEMKNRLIATAKRRDITKRELSAVKSLIQFFRHCEEQLQTIHKQATGRRF